MFRRIAATLVFGSVLCGLLLAGSPAWAGAIRGRWIVTTATGAAPAAAARRTVAGLSATVVKYLPRHGLMVVTSPTGADEAQVLARLRATPGIRFVERDGTRRLAEVPDDPLYPQQWNMKLIGMQAAWEVTHGSPSVKIAVIDSGLRLDSAEFTGRIDTANAWDYVRSDALPDDENYYSHGSHVTGIAAATANNAKLMAGMAGDCTVLPLKVFGPGPTSTWSDVILAIYRAADADADVINMSLGEYAYSAAEASACAYAVSKGCIVVAAAGNEATSAPHYPSAHPGVVAVASTDGLDTRSYFSNFGPWVDLSAPGSDIISLTKADAGMWSGGIAHLSGTSMASPHVAGLAAMISSHEPTWTPEMVVERMQATAKDLGTPGWDADFGWGRIDCKAALDATEPPPPLPKPAIIAVEGGDRYETAAAAAREGWPSGAKTVLVATGLSFADALSASSLAGAYEAPLLLVKLNEVPAAVS
jgi:subtilisin family serine protease